MVLNGITGAAGLAPTLAALEAGRTLALANKESLVIGGPLVTGAARPGQIVAGRLRALGARPVPAGGTRRRGRPAGPDRQRRPVPRADPGAAGDVTPAQALAHPTWDMGRVITTNSATLVNKGLELLEAHLLFGVDLDRIDVVVHPQSIVHSMVAVRRRLDAGPVLAAGHEAADRARAELAGPAARGRPACDWTTAAQLDLRAAGRRGLPGGRAGPPGRVGCGGTAPAVYNAANEECVDAFHAGRIGFLDILEIVEQVLSEHVELFDRRHPRPCRLDAAT